MTAAGRAESLRLFVACELSDEIRAALARVQDELQNSGAGNLRWVRPEGIHITLKFLGQVERERVPEVTAALASMITDRVDRNVQVHLVFGNLGIEWAEDGDVYQEGPATEVYTGAWPNGAL